MRVYGSIQTSFWANPNAQKLSDQGKLLMTYLFTGPHSNMLGCFRLPAGYISEDLCWDIEKIKAVFLELANNNFVTRDSTSGWMVIHDFLKLNPIHNIRQAKGVENLFSIVPTESTILNQVIHELISYGKYFNNDFIKGIHTLNKSVSTLSNASATNQNKDKNQDQNQIISSLQEDVVSETNNITQPDKLNCPQEDIVKLYHTILSMCPPVRIWNKTRQSYLRQRWNEHEKHQNLEWWENYFNYVKQSDFLIGKVDGQPGKPPFIVNLEWLVRSSNFIKVIEGKYHGGIV